MIVLYNPHVDDFIGEPPHFRLLGRRALKKYGFLPKALHEGQGEVPVVVDGTVSAFLPARYFRLLPAFIRRPIAGFEFGLWRRRNLIPGLRRVPLNDPANKEKTLLAFSYKAAGHHPDQAVAFRAFRHVVFHLSHYFVYTDRKAEFLRNVENAWLAGDSDISANSYFQRYFSWYTRPFLTLPFAVSERFDLRKQFNERESRCVAMGSIHDLSREVPAAAYSAYMTATGFTTYHPLRAALHQAKSSVADLVEVKVSPYRDYDSSDSVLSKLFKHVSVKQKVHFSFDLVDLYNSYQFAVIGEEASGFPALGMFEAMACGCVTFADPRALCDLGFENGKHYLAHDGTLNGFLTALHLGQHMAGVEEIGRNGMDYVKANYSPAVIGSRWFQSLSQLGEFDERTHVNGAH